MHHSLCIHHLLKDILVSSKFGQLLIHFYKLKWTSTCRSLCGHKFSTPLGTYQGEWLLRHVVRVCLVCKKLPNCLPKWLGATCNPASNNRDFRCCTSLPAFGVFSVPNIGHSGRCVVLSHFNLHFPDDTWYAASFFICIFAICTSSLGRCLLMKVIGSFLIWFS